MKTSKVLLSLALLALVCSPAEAQNFLKRLENRAKNTVENSISNKVERGIRNAMDGKTTGDPERDDARRERKRERNTGEEIIVDAPAESQNGWTCPSCGTTGNTGKFCNECGTKKPEGGDATWTCPSCGATGTTGKFCNECGTRKPDGTADKAKANWNSYDFVFGDEIIFEDTQENEQIGEFPSMWDVFNGYAQIVELNGVKCIALADDGQITPLFNDNKPYLTDQFTIEYDVYVVYGPDYGTDFNPHSWKMGTYLVTLKSDDRIRSYYGGDRTFEFNHQVSSGERVLNDAYFSYEWPLPSLDETRSGNAILNDVSTNAWHHVAVSFNKRAYKVYFDENRVVNIPNAAKPDYFWIGCNQHEHVFFIKNVRIAKGAVPLYDRLASDGKIVTYAITFDTGKATLKPESTGEINRITKIMQEDPSIKFEVQGHCDNTGSDRVNDPLSQKRAEAIVEALVANGIDASRLTAVGKGAHVPIADNGTDEGRAKNRRVEFVKK